MSEIVARCVQCYSEFTEEQIKGVSGCPGCGSTGLPMSPAEDITLKINWHELRILTIWAEHWANHIAGNPDVKNDPVKTIWAICGRLQEQWPTKAPLTLSAELAQVKEKFKDAEFKGNIREGAPLPPRIN